MKNKEYEINEMNLQEGFEELNVQLAEIHENLNQLGVVMKEILEVIKLKNSAR